MKLYLRFSVNQLMEGVCIYSREKKCLIFVHVWPGNPLANHPPHLQVAFNLRTPRRVAVNSCKLQKLQEVTRRCECAKCKMLHLLVLVKFHITALTRTRWNPVNLNILQNVRSDDPLSSFEMFFYVILCGKGCISSSGRPRRWVALTSCDCNCKKWCFTASVQSAICCNWLSDD